MYSTLKCTEKEIINKISTQLTELKEKEKEITELKAKFASDAVDDILNYVKEINGVKANCW